MNDIKENIFLNHFFQGLVISGFILIVLGAVMGPLTSMIAANLQLVSLFEFYLIYVLLKDSNNNVSLKNWAQHIAFDLKDLAYYALYFGTYVFGASSIFASFLYSMQPTSFVLNMATGYFVLKTYIGLQVLLFLVSFVIDTPAYEYIGLTPLVCSIMFAIITDAAAACIITTPIIAGLLYFCSIIPLLYFLSTAKDNVVSHKEENTSKISNLLDNLYYHIGATSLILHIIEAACFSVSVFFPAARVGADVIRHPVTQIALNTITTLAAGVKITELMVPRNDTSAELISV